jgi:thiamine biosynthesis lipoprotein
VEAAALAMLRRALDFCLWSERAHGPLGGVVYELWQGSLPSGDALGAASQTAACDRLLIDEEAGTARLAAGSRVDLRGFAPGWAVDRAVEVLRGHGAANARIRLGGIERGLGPGPFGEGWAAEVDLPPAWLEALPPPRLRDRALAVADRDPVRVIAGDRYSTHLNLRDGRPADGVLATIALSELAVDAQALARTMFLLGQREGMLRLGSLRPEPSVAWLLGSGEAQPLLTTHRWAAAE